MKGFNRCLFYALSFVLLSTVFCTATSNNASAYTVTTMPTVRNINSLEIGGGTKYGTHDPCFTGSLTIGDLISTSTSIPLSYKNAYGIDGSTDTFISSYKAAISSGSGFGAFQGDYNGATGDPQTVTLFYFDSATTFTFSSSGQYIYSTNAIHMITFGYNYNAGCRYQKLTDSNSGTSSDGSYNLYLPQIQFYLFVTDNIEYPSGYTGDTYAKTHQSYYPDWSWTVDKAGNYSITYTKNLTQYNLTQKANSCVLGGTTSDHFGDGTPLQTECDTQTPYQAATFTGNLATLNSGYTFTRFFFTLRYGDGTGDAAAPDNTGIIHSTQVAIDWSPGQVSTGTTTGGTADQTSGSPAAANWFDGINNYLPANVKQMYVPLNSVASLVTSIPSYGSSCSTLVIPMPRIGNINLQCLKSTVYQPYFGGFFAIYQLVINALVTYYVGVNILSKFKNQISGDDKIEVVDL